MQSKISCSKNGSLQTSPQTGTAISWFNTTVFRKNLTRFAPVWVIYALILCTYLVMFYYNEVRFSEYSRVLGFIYSFAWGFEEVFMFWNLAYGLLTAQLLFGDLFNSRMCNSLHAMPLKRETWFVTNCLSGLAFSVIPTLVAALVLLPMALTSVVANAWIIPPLWFLSVNLQYICCFGIAAFAAMCVGSRLTMAAGYGLLQFGAYIVFWLVDTVYTPMLYGVITPTTLVGNLTPLAHMMEHTFLTLENMIHEYQLMEKGISLADLAEMNIHFTLTEEWWRLFAIAGVGILFALLAMLLYRCRDLECAGDAVAFPVLKPVFQVLCALFVMWAGQFVVSYILGIRDFGIPIMAVCLAVGWFIGKMLLERNTRVFRLKNWYGLGVLAACIALTLVATHFDILNIEQRLPDRDKIEKVYLQTNQTGQREIPKDKWEDVFRIHTLAVDHRVEELGIYVIQPDGSRTLYTGEPLAYAMDIKQTVSVEDVLGYEEYVQTGNVRILYEMKNGTSMTRRYDIWTDGEIGGLTRKILSNWEYLTGDMIREDGELVDVLQAALDDFISLAVTGNSYRDMPRLTEKQEAESFLQAVKADCEAGLMIQDDRFHRGVYTREVEDDYSGETYDDTRDCIYASIESRQSVWEVRVYPDCVNTMNWLLDRGLVIYTVYPDAIMLPG